MASRNSSLTQLPTAPIVGGAVLTSFVVGALMADRPMIAIALLVAAIYVPLVLIDLPLAIALWAPLLFLKDLAHVDTVAHVALGLLALAWLAQIRSRRATVLAVLRRHRALISVLVLLLLWLSLSVVWAERPDLVGAPLARWFTSAFIFLLVATAISNRRHMSLLVAGFVVGGVASVVAGIANGGLQPSAGTIDTVATAGGRLTGGAGDPNELAQGLVPAIVLAAALLGEVRKPVLRLAILISIALMTVGFAASESRGGVVAVIVAVIGSLALQRGYRRRVLSFVALTLAAAAVWFALSPGALQRVTTFDSSGTGRSELWRVAWYMAEDHPIVGVGVNNYPVLAADYVRRPGALHFVHLIVNRPHEVHNVYLQAFAETGVIGLVLLVVVLAAALSTSWLAAQRFEQLGDRAFAALSRAVLVATLSFLSAAFFLTDGFDSRLWLLLGMGPALLAIARQRARAAPRV